MQFIPYPEYCAYPAADGRAYSTLSPTARAQEMSGDPKEPLGKHRRRALHGEVDCAGFERVRAHQDAATAPEVAPNPDRCVVLHFNDAGFRVFHAFPHL